VDNTWRTIWENEDDFVNICIDKTKTIYSSGGQLHCLDHELHTSMKLIR